MSKNLDLSIGLLIALVGFPQISETIYTPALPAVAASLSANIQMVEATLTIYFFGFALGVLLWGAISDFCGRRLAMFFGLVIYGIGTLACGKSGSVEVLLAWRFVQAFGASVGSVITQTIIRDAFNGTERAKLFSVMSGALAFSPALGPVLGGFISEFMGWRANFWVLALIAGMLLMWSFFKLPETRPMHIVRPNIIQTGDLINRMMRTGTLWGHVLLIGSTNGILFGFYQEAPFVFIDQMGMRPTVYGLFGLLIAAATILAARFSYRKINKYSADTIIQWGSFSLLVGSLLFTAIVVAGAFNSDVMGMGIVYVALLMIFFGIGLIIPNSLSMALKPYQQAVGTAGSIFGGCYYCFIAGNTWLMSVLHNGTALPLPLYMTALSMIIIVGTWIIRKKLSNTDHDSKAQEQKHYPNNNLDGSECHFVR